MKRPNESLIKERDSYYVLRHKPTGLYVHEPDLNCGHYDLEKTGLFDNQLFFGPMRINPRPGTESDVARQLNQEARRVIDWLNRNDHYVAGDDSEYDYEYSDFELLLVEVEYRVKHTQPIQVTESTGGDCSLPDSAPFDIIPSCTNVEGVQAANALYLGHTVARQGGDKAVRQ
jgi:hypothetical protein